MYTKPSTSPKRQYVATAIFALLAIVSSLSVINNNGQINAQTVSYTQEQTGEGHSQTLQELAWEEYLRTTK